MEESSDHVEQQHERVQGKFKEKSTSSPERGRDEALEGSMHVIAQDESRLALLETARRRMQLGAPEKDSVRFSNTFAKPDFVGFSNTSVKPRTTFVSYRNSDIIGMKVSR